MRLNISDSLFFPMEVNAFGLPELDILLQEDLGDECSCVIAFFGLITDTLFLLSYS